MNKQPIDIIVPWVNPNDKIWKKEFLFWREKEAGDKQDGRFRDCNTLKYVLRSIEQNCNWYRYIFLVLSSKSQIPTWLNISNSKLKIVYHKNFIPEKYLPTFNSLLIEMFYCFIEGLSENFILMNDDMFFCQNKNEEFFFQNDLPVYKIEKIKYTNTSEFFQWQQNSLNLLKTISHCTPMHINTFHLPICYNKSLCNFIMNKIQNRFDLYFCNSKFRQKTNLIHFIFAYSHFMLNQYINDNSNRGVFYFFKNNKRQFDLNYPMVCLNESGAIDQTDIEYLTFQLETKFNNKSSFELS